MGYQVKELLASPYTFTYGRGGYSPDYIVIHFTGGTGTAKQNCQYFSGGNRNSSAHLFIDGIDDGIVWKSVLISNTAWATGNFNFNQRSISIEVVSNGEDFSEVEIKKLAWIVPILMRDYGIPASRVIRHYDVVDYATVGRTVDPHKHCPAPYVNYSKWSKLHSQITSGNTVSDDLGYSQVDVDGWIGNGCVTALQKIFDIYENGIFWGQPVGWKQYHPRITDSAIRYESDPDYMAGSEVVMNMQRLCGYSQSGYLSKGFIEAWQGFVSDSLAQDGYFGEGTAKATQRWINYQLKKNKIKL